MQKIFLRRTAIFVALGLAYTGWVHPTRADEAKKAALIEEMFVVTKTETMVQQIMEQVKAMQKAQLQKMDLPAEAQANSKETLEQVSALINERLAWPKLKPIYVKLYMETFNEEELRAIVEFYQSPGGRALLDKMPVLMSKSIEAVQEQMGDFSSELKRRVEKQSEKRREPRDQKLAEPKTP